MRSGGEADKLANAYEGLWTTYQLLEVLRGDALSITVEPIEDEIGIEFYKTLPNGVRESHSVKIQTPRNGWTVAELLRDRRNGRSFLGDLIEKTIANRSNQACFVSEVSANSLRILCEEASRAKDCPTFRLYLEKANVQLRDGFRSISTKLCSGQEETAWNQLRRIRVSTVTRPELLKFIDRDIARAFYRTDGTPLDAPGVRRLLIEFVLDSLRQEITRSTILERLASDQIAETNWAFDPNIERLVGDRNRTYLSQVRGQLINNASIPRQEALAAFRLLTKGTEKFGIFVGVAGAGKSCATAELLERLIDASIPCLALRMDVETEELTARGFGQKLNLPTSPVDVLDGMAGGSLSVLLVDQLDALSIASGGNQNLWQVFQDLIEQAVSCRNLKVWLTCRAFDLEHDPRLRALAKREKAHQIPISLLEPELVKAEIRKAHTDPEMIGPRQVEMLRTPMHLSLYLESEPAGKPPFQTVLELYDRYWTRKRELVAERLRRSPYWNEVIDLLCEKLIQTVGAPAGLLEDTFPEDVQLMASAHVIVKENSTYRFFHEGFFDYAFARRFVSGGRKLLDDLLLVGDQGLKVRGQVRQVLSYLRSKDKAGYLVELARLFTESKVRAHVQRLVLDWMQTLPDPWPEEARILKLDVA